MAIKLQKHQRETVERAREALRPLGCELWVDEARPRVHIKLLVVHVASGRRTTIGMASSPKNRDHAIRAVIKQAVQAAKGLT